MLTVKEARLVVAQLCLAALLAVAAGCRQPSRPAGPPAPLPLRDVPADRLAYHLETDVAAPTPDEDEQKADPVQADFDKRRKDEALIRTVVSPDGQRALALYETANEPPGSGEFRIDMYSSDGMFLRNMMPPEMVGAFAPKVAWSHDGNYIAFIGRKGPHEAPPDTGPLLPQGSPGASPPAPVAPAVPGAAPVAVLDTEQIYVTDRDGFNLKLVTSRNGLIYFDLAWAPDNHAIASRACKEDEWDARESQHKSPAGRPRLIDFNGGERLLSDDLAEAPVVWSPDSSKVATAFDTDLAIYDAASTEPTAAQIDLREALLAASAEYDENRLKKPSPANGNKPGGGSGSKVQPSAASNSPASGTPLSFNPIVDLKWPEPETILVETGYVRRYNPPVSNFMRWHSLHLSPQGWRFGPPLTTK